MLKIRQGLFETNSSSTHSLILCNDEEYEKLRKKELYIDDDDYLISQEEKDEILYDLLEHKTEEEKDEILNSPPSDYGLPETLEEWQDDEYLEYGEDEYKTKSGEIVHALYKYGYEG